MQRVYKPVCLLLACVSLITSALMSHFKLSTLNVNGAIDVRKRACIFETLKLKKMNVMMLRETHIDVFNETDWRREFDGQVFLSHFKSTSAGVALLFSKYFCPVSHVVEERVKGRLLVVKAKYERFNIVFIN